MPPPAPVSSVHQMEQLLFFTLLQLLIIVLAGRAGGWAAARLGQSRVVGEILVGILLGPSLFGLLFPDAFAYVFQSASPMPMTVMSQVGLILLMFQIGLDFDFDHLRARENRRAVVWVAVVGLIAPFLAGVGFALASVDALFPSGNRTAFALFVGTAFAITAVPVLGRIMMDFGITRTSVGVIAISAAAINDVVGWLLLAGVSAWSMAHFSGGEMALRTFALLAFAAFAWWVVRPALHWLIARMLRDAPRAANMDPRLPPDLLAIILALVFAFGLATFQIGVFAIFGGFLVGVLLYSEQRFVAAWKARMEDFVGVFFLPIFFTYTGLRTEIGSLSTPALWGWCALLLVLATVGKFVACYFAARVAGMTRVESRLLGVMMNTRGLMELVVINVGYDLGVIPQTVFTMLVIMAVVSTIVTSPGLRRWLPQAGLTAAAR